MIKCLLTFTSVLGVACIIAYTYFIWCCILKMDKLVKLLNEYEREMQWLPKDFEDYTMWNIEWNEIVQPSCDPDSREYFKYYIISKDYQFIKWLVENDKIETNNLSLRAFKNIFSGGWFVEVSDLEVILMLLATSDTPIQDLCVWLK